MNKPDFNKISPWCDIEPVTIAGQSFVKIPKFYYKCGVDVKGRVYWIVSGSPFSGGELYPLFKRILININLYKPDEYGDTDEYSNNLNYIYIGAYANSIIGTDGEGEPIIGSVKGNMPYVVGASDYAKTLKKSQSILKDAGITNVDMISYPVQTAIHLLCLIESGHSDIKSIWGKGNVDSGIVKPVGTSNDCYRGFYDLWGNVATLTGRGELGYGGSIVNGAHKARPAHLYDTVPNSVIGYVDTMKDIESNMFLWECKGCARTDLNHPNPYHSYNEVNYKGSSKEQDSRPVVMGGGCNSGQKAGIFSYFNIKEGVSRTMCIDAGALSPK